MIAVLRTVAGRRAQILVGIAAIAIVTGGALHVSHDAMAGDAVWRWAIAVLGVELAVEVVTTIAVQHRMGVDVIALVAMGGALALGEELAGVVIGLMFSGGSALEELAATRARRELTALVQRAPSVAQRRVGDRLELVSVEALQPGDDVVVGTGSVVPVDGTLISEEAVLDTSTLSGEPLPVTVTRGMKVLSGAANAGDPLELSAERSAAESAYATLVALVRHAESERAPFMRLADRYAGWFLAATVVLAGGAWALSGDPVRGLAVVVVATPCPLILAAPIALVCGLSRAAGQGIIVKGASAIEGLGRARTVLFDKTGTLTVGTPEVRDVIAVGEHPAGEVLRLAASVDQVSAHVLADALAQAAGSNGLKLALPGQVQESPGQGIAGVVEGHRVAVGSRGFVTGCGVPAVEVAAAIAATGHGSGEAHVLVAIDQRLAGDIVLADEVRPDAERAIARLREEGVGHIAMLSGDRRSVAERVGGQLGLDQVYSEQSPEAKLEVVRRTCGQPRLSPAVMVGDGVNDAPALAAADVGIAMGAAGATVSSQTADAVITVDRIERVADAVHCGRRSLSIARQSVLAGMGLSIAAMGAACAGLLTPLAGALLQEGIDLAVILNALRALRG